MAELRRALAPALPFLMLPLHLVLAPAKPKPQDSHGGGGNGGGAGGGFVSEMPGREGKMPARVREKALLCVAAALKGGGSRFVEVGGRRQMYVNNVLYVSPEIRNDGVRCPRGFCVFERHLPIPRSGVGVCYCKASFCGIPVVHAGDHFPKVHQA